MIYHVDVEEVYRLQARLDEINSIDLREIIWLENGKPLDIPHSTIEKFRYTGLGNKEFILTDYYKENPRTEPCCECGNSYPRYELLAGEIFCSECRDRRVVA